MRGTLNLFLRFFQLVRFIPAHAGNARIRFLRDADFSVHPRACGERVRRPPLAQAWPGSSPRMRGTLDFFLCFHSPLRFIPAHAGNAIDREMSSWIVSVHPRACGERYCCCLCQQLGTGSSPRMRGTRSLHLVAFMIGRFIPAHAGNAPSTGATYRPLPGSSPRMRGTLISLLRRREERRFIPAHAGNAWRKLLALA